MGTGLQTGMRTGTSTGGRPQGNFISKIQNLFQSLTPRQKIVGLGMIVLLVGIVLVANLIVKSSAYVPIYSQDISQGEAQAISMKLADIGIDCQMSEGNKMVLVSPRVKAKAVMKLAYFGYPHRQRPEVAQKPGGMTPPTERELSAKERENLEWDLIESIRTMDGVADAYVKLVIPEKAYFSGDEDISKAAVILRLQPGCVLSQTQVNAIISLVAHSVPRLKMENVGVSDTDGNIHIASNEKSDREIAKNNDERVNDFEKRLEAKVKEALDPVLGVDNYTVGLTVAMDFSQKKIEKEAHGGPANVEGVVKMGEKTNITTLDSSNKDENTDVEQMANNVKKLLKPGMEYKEVQKEVVNKVNTVKETIIAAPGTVDRISVSLAVNNLDKEQVSVLKQFVGGIVGYDASRGDQVIVTSLPFSQDIMKDMRNQFANLPPIPAKRTTAVSSQWVLTLALMPMIILFLIMGFFLARQKSVAFAQSRIFTGTADETNLGTITDLTSDKVGKGTVASRDATANISSKLEMLAKEKPTKVAELLKSTWLADKER